MRPSQGIEWVYGQQPVAYNDALLLMEQRVKAVQTQQAPELIWLLEHPPLYTAGSSAKPAEILRPDDLPVFPSPRGGKYTYHGPGQRVVYLILNLTRREKDVHKYVMALGNWVVAVLAQLGVQAKTDPRHIGVWVNCNRQEKKLAAIGVRLQHWVTSHGVAINVAPDMSYFQGIIPCGLHELGVTSLQELGVTIDYSTLDKLFFQELPKIDFLSKLT